MGKTSNSKNFYVKTRILRTCFLFYSVAIWTNGSKVVVDKIANTVAQIKAVEPNYIKSLCIIHHALKMGGGRTVLLKIVIDEALKLINFVKLKFSLIVFLICHVMK